MGIDTKTAEELLNHLYEDKPFPLYDTSKRNEVLDEFRELRASKNLLDDADKSSPNQHSLDRIFDLAQETGSKRKGLSLTPLSRRIVSIAASFLLVAVVGFWMQNEKAQEEALANEEIKMLLEESSPWENSLSDWNDHPTELDYLHMRTQEMQRVSESVSWDELFIDPRMIPNQGSLQQAASSGN